MNNMLFDLIIANPPFGKSSSLSKKIVNKMLENRVAEEMVVLAPPKTFFESAKFIKDYIDVGLTSDLFDIPAANGIGVGIAKYTDQVVNRYTEKSLRFTDKKLLQLEEALTTYNSIHETIEDTKYKHCGLSPKGVAYFKAEIEKGLDPCRIFLIPYYTPLNGARWGECGDHNNGIKLWDFQNGKTSSATVIVLKEGYKKNFCKWWYKDYEDKEKNWKNLHYAICRVIKAAWSDSPGSVAFLQYLPQVDWSHPWTDQEILAEIGLPEDFLEKE